MNATAAAEIRLEGVRKQYPGGTMAVNDLLQGLDQTKRLEFLKQWQAALGRK